MTARPGASRFSAAVGALCATVLLAGCATNALKQGEAAEGARDYDLAVAEYTKALREHPNDADIQQDLDRAKLRASEAHLVNGRRLYA